MITRRKIVISLGAGAFASFASFAQQPLAKVFRIGYLGPSPAAAPGLLDAFRDGLRERGYVEGRNLAIEYRYTDGTGKGYAAEAGDLVQDPELDTGAGDEYDRIARAVWLPAQFSWPISDG